MNRWSKIPSTRDNFLAGEFVISEQDAVGLYDGERKTDLVGGRLTLTSHRLIWRNPAVYRTMDMTLSLQHVLLVEEEPGSFLQSDKLLLHLTPPQPTSTPSFKSDDFIKLAFKQGGLSQFASKLREALAEQHWDAKVRGRVVRPGKRDIKLRSGIGGIEKALEQRRKETNNEISKAFQDVNKLMERAKPMVELAKAISGKIRDRQSITDDETSRFKSYLMSLGISDPVTRDSHGSGQSYFKELANEVYSILQKPLNECGGMMALTDAFCRVNRARGLDLLSPEDLFGACKVFNEISSKLPIRLHTFSSTGVTVLQLTSSDMSSEEVLSTTEEIVSNFKVGLTAEELAREAGIAVFLATERLLAAESAGRVCRDDSVQGMKFFPNFFLKQS